MKLNISSKEVTPCPTGDKKTAKPHI